MRRQPHECAQSTERTTTPMPASRADYANPDKIHPIGHVGQYFQVPGVHLCEPSLQRTPVLYQAGASTRGRQFGAENAEWCSSGRRPRRCCVTRRPGTLRHKLFGRGERLPETHRAAGYRRVSQEAVR